MGLYDTVILEKSVELPLFPDDVAPHEIDWQSKDIGRPAMQTYKISADGRLLRQEREYREKTPKEKQEEAEEHGFDSWEELVKFCEESDPQECLERGIGIGRPSEETVDEVFWVDHNHHGTFEFHAHGNRIEGVDDIYWSYEARFTRGDLDSIVFLGDRFDG